MRETLSYSSIFSYVPRKHFPLPTSDLQSEADIALEFMQCLKNNWSFRTGSLSIEPSKHVAQISGKISHNGVFFTVMQCWFQSLGLLQLGRATYGLLMK
jgi:hypothetical protein